jgi:hypothetical protein
MIEWVRAMPNLSLGAYEIYVAQDGLPDPVFPDLPFQDLLRIAFRDRIVDSEHHLVVKMLRGRA